MVEEPTSSSHSRSAFASAGDAAEAAKDMWSNWRELTPTKLLSIRPRFSYQLLPADDQHGSTLTFQSLKGFRFPSPRHARDRLWSMRLSPIRLVTALLAFLLFLSLLVGSTLLLRKVVLPHRAIKDLPYYWQHYERLNGYYNGIRTLVPFSQYHPENHYNLSHPVQLILPNDARNLSKQPPVSPVVFNPFPDYNSDRYLQHHERMERCYLDAQEKTPAPDIYAYPGLPQNMSEHFLGSYQLLGLEHKICFDRFGRLGPYGYGYNYSQGGLGPGSASERTGSEKVFAQAGIIDYTSMDWGSAQRRCREKNKARFGLQSDSDKVRVKRHAFVLRIWTGYFFNDYQIYSLRAMISELSLKSGGEYDVHFLLHVKNDSIPIWADKTVYQQTIEDNMPEEFWTMTTLWSEAQMTNYYPGPFPDNVANEAGRGIHGVYRSAHFPLQWFSQEHPEYDFYWNWEMDMRLNGHYYDFNEKIGDWARNQPRKGLWERNRRFYIPKYHGSWEDFTRRVQVESGEAGVDPIWGPVLFNNTGMLPPTPGTTPPTSYDDDNFQWGVGEDADFMVFNPLFDPDTTNWVFRTDVTGYNLARPIPPRRCAIVTVARMSKRLLDIMHEEVWRMRHTMFTEMWPGSVCLHHGLKAVYVPHPVYFDRDWDLPHMDRVFNHPQHPWESTFGWGEHNLFGSSFYFNNYFSAALWRRWLGQSENHEGGRRREEEGTGRMCLRTSLHHPVKHEGGPVG